MATGTSSLVGKAIILTGGGGDMGSATIRLILDRGGCVAVLDKSAETLARLSKEVARPDDLFTAPCDVTSETDVAARFADPREIAQVIAFLLSDDASVVNAALFSVNGGVSAL